MINVLVNGLKKEMADDTTLSKAIEFLGYQKQSFAVAINETFVVRHDYDTKTLSNGDRIDIIAPVQGG